MFYKLLIAYCGSPYSGWQRQPNAITVQQMIEEALVPLFHGASIKLIGSGRTDAGVHARGQVAHFCSDLDVDVRRLRLSLNGLLPHDIRILEVERLQQPFHAQRDAVSKEYHYYLHLDPVMDPFRYGYAWHILRPCSRALLVEAAKHFVGTHDFTSYANEPNAGAVAKNPVRTLYRVDVRDVQGGVGIEFEGNGFLYKMVRNMVGMIVDVATARRDLGEIERVFALRDRRAAPRAAPAHGLFLMRVDYP